MTTFKKRRNLFSTATLISLFLFTEPKETEQEESEFIKEGFLGVGQDKYPNLLEKTMQDLLEGGYIDLTDKGPVLTPWGKKVALTATNDTPNLAQLANNNVNTAFAMLFAAFTGLKKFIGDDKIVAGKTTQLVDNLKELRDWIDSKIEEEKKSKKK